MCWRWSIPTSYFHTALAFSKEQCVQKPLRAAALALQAASQRPVVSVHVMMYRVGPDLLPGVPVSAGR